MILFNCFYSSEAQSNIESLKQERVYLHTDRNIYIAGDNLFYTLYLKGNPGQMSKYAYLILRDRHNSIITHIRLEIDNRKAFGNILLPDTLHSDMYQLVCYTNLMRNEGENSYFKKEIIITNRFDKKLELFDSTSIDPSAGLTSMHSINETGNGNLIIHLDKQTFNTREKAIFSIETKSIPGDSITRLSVSVSEVFPGSPDEPSISDYFNNTSRQEDSSDPFQYNRNYHSEVQGSVIEGRVIHIPAPGYQPVVGKSGSVRDINNYTIIVSTPDSIANMQYTTTDSLGLFSIFLNRYYEGKELFIRLKENEKASIELDNIFKLIKPFTPTDLLNVRGIRSYLLRNLNISEVQRYYTERGATDTLKETEQPIAIPKVYYKPYSKVYPADYLPLSDFVEISREILPALKVRKNNDSYNLSFINTRNKGFPEAEPVIFLDGVPIDDVNQIINLGTDQIKRIDILPATRYYGEIPLPGILAVFSKNLEIYKIQFKTPTVRYHSLASQIHTKPLLFIPADGNKRIPDLRQVLLWDPEIILHNKELKQIECYTSDLRGIYLINIQGITSNGLPVNGSAVFTVKTKSN